MTELCTYFTAIIITLSQIEHIKRLYMVDKWRDHEHFLELIARKRGKLMKGGEPDINCIARSIIHDWQRGKLPFFVAPPRCVLFRFVSIMTGFFTYFAAMIIICFAS